MSRNLKMSRRARAKEDGWEGFGGYMNAKRQKLKDQFDKEAPNQLKKEGSGSRIFSGVSIHVNGYTKPSSDELKRLMMLHGGAYEHYLYRTRVTHVIATNLPNSKVRELKGLKVVKPEWITESIAAGRLLNYSNYLLYTAKSGLQTGLRGFSVTENGDQSSDVTMTTEKNSPLASNSNQSVSDSLQLDTGISDLLDNEINSKENVSNRMEIVINSKDKITNSKENETSNKENFSFNEFPNADQNSPTNLNQTGTSLYQPGTNFNQNNFVMTQRSPEGILKTIPAKASTSVSHTSPGKTSTAVDPNFINDYYNNSRLHFLSTWKAEFKSYVNELQKQGTSFPGRERLRKIVNERKMSGNMDGQEGRIGKPSRCVMHIDMDCFFVSVGLKDRPDLKGKPVAVTHSKGKSAVQDPEADPSFERQQWELKRLNGGKRGKQTVKNVHTTEMSVEDTSFPDKSDSDDDIDDDASVATKSTAEPFHSMAEIASCSYEARQCGVKNGMFMGKAKTFCPELVTIPYDFQQYKVVSKILYDTVASYSHDIEAVSCDEMLVDCTELLADTGATPSQFTSLLRDEIFHKTGCCASAGLASNVLLAKMATRKAKPNGQFHLPCDMVNEFITPQSVKDIPGVGWSLNKRLESMKVLTCGDLQRVALDTLQKEFGPKTGQSLYRYCRGEDERSVKIEQQRKSVSAEVNYGIRFTNNTEAYTFIQDLSTEVCSRLRSILMKGKTVTLKLMIRREDAPKQTSKFMGHGICNNFSKSVTLPMATDDSKIIGQECLSILKQQKCVASDLRGIGIQIQRLEPAVVGQSNNAKYPSILNFTVNKTNSNSMAETSIHKLDQTQQRPFVSQANQTNRQQGVDKEDINGVFKALQKHRQESSNSSRVDAFSSEDVNDNMHIANCDRLMLNEEETRRKRHSKSDIRTEICNMGTEKLDRRVSEDFNETCDKDFRTMTSNTDIRMPDKVVSTDLNETNEFHRICSTSNKGKEIHDEVVTTDVNETNTIVLDDVTQPSPPSNVIVGEIGAESSDLLRDLGRRQMKSSQLPPLPCLPVIKSPDNSQPDDIDVNTPQAARQHRESQRDAVTDDYFPSPSQIDPDVLKELPPEIRLQVEKEMESRRKVQTVSSRRTRSNQGCSHWQQSQGDHSAQTTQIKGSHSGGFQEIRESHSDDTLHAKGSHSKNIAVSMGDNSAQVEAGRNNADCEIVPLPSSSQLDLSCLNALPESLQDEILQAYARQGQNAGDNPSGMMNLQQAKSPRKSPSKKSPTKRSPQFKVPRGRPNARGRKKGSSKKLVFKDQQKLASKVVEKSSCNTTDSDAERRTDNSNTNNLRVPLPSASNELNMTIELSTDIITTDGSNADDHLYPDTVDQHCEGTVSKGDANAGKVNLCGAVEIMEVRNLIKEWVASTPVPQSEDEEVLLEYIYALVRDKNLEHVDLVLKSMHRNINRIENMDWLSSLKRIHRDTQSIVREYHGYSLKSITI